ncbi:MAG TPA: rhombosortase [Steroidobacteraceae bacterium]
MKSIRTDSSSQSWFRSANCDARYGAALLAALGVILGLCALGEGGRELLRYERLALSHWQWWRLVTAHLVHLSLEHALLNGAALALLWMLLAREFTPRRWAWILLASAAAIDAGLWFLRPAVEWYLGASGVLHGALAAGAAALYRRGEGLGAALLLLLVVKLIHEHVSGASLFMGTLPLVPDAHLFGALGGLLGAWTAQRAGKSL